MEKLAEVIEFPVNRISPAVEQWRKAPVIPIDCISDYEPMTYVNTEGREAYVMPDDIA